MENPFLLLIISGYFLSGVIAFGVAKYHFTETYHYHDNDEYSQAFTVFDHFLFGFVCLLSGYFSLAICLILAYVNDRSKVEFPDHRLGLAFTKNIRLPNYHRQP